MKQITMKFVGLSPILLSCDRLADPLDPRTVAHRALTSKRNKTEEDHLAIARSQWEGLMYWDDAMGVYIPTQNLRATILNGAKMNKLGTHIKKGFMIFEEKVGLDYGKKLSMDELWDQKYIDRRSVVVGGARVMAYRPKFDKWSVTFTGMFDENILNAENIVQSAKNAGLYVGLCGYRPEKSGTFGRFEVEVV